jgi:peroxiredoxin
MPIAPGQPAPDFSATALDGSVVELARLRGQPVWLAFFRWAACPFCNYRIHELIAQWERRFSKHRFTMLGVFQSPADRCQAALGSKQLPFALLPDPDMGLYRLYQIESGVRGMLSLDVPKTMLAARRQGIPIITPTEGPATRIPADFLIDATGIIRVAFYGRNITEHIPFEDVERFIEAQPRAVESSFRPAK